MLIVSLSFDLPLSLFRADRRGNTFATRIGNVFIIGDGAKPAISLPKAKGVKLSVIEERDQQGKKKE